MCGIYGGIDPSAHLDDGTRAWLRSAWQLFREHQAGADRSDLLLRWLVLIRRCREAQPS
jgi:hypothetical protein